MAGVSPPRPFRLVRGGFSVALAIGFVVGSTLSASALSSAAGDAVLAIAKPSPTNPMADPATPPDRAAHPHTGNPLWAIPLESLSSTRERPLFSPSRRPPPAVVAAPAAPPPAPSKPAEPDHPSLTLVGTAVGSGLSLGVFLDPATKDVVRLRTGEGHAGWILRAVQEGEATFERDRHEVTLALPARNATGQVTASVARPAAPARSQDAPEAENRNPIEHVSAAASHADGQARLLPAGKWLDGDGQVIDAPAQATATTDGAKPHLATWLDGDGQSISAPPLPRTTEDGKPLGPAVWLDGYGRPIGPAPAAWKDGDGQSIAPPPYRWLDQNGKPIIPPPATWQDGDGQLIGAPLQRHAAK